MSRPETRRQRLDRLLSEIEQIGSPKQRARAARIGDELRDGSRRLSPTTMGLVEECWQAAINHAANVRLLYRRPPPGCIWVWAWRAGHLLHDVWAPAEIRPGSVLAAVVTTELRA